MKQQEWLLMGLGGAVLLWLASRTETGEEIISDAVGTAVDYGGKVLTDVADYSDAAWGYGSDVVTGIADYTGDIMNTIRGIRNNNPGNIRISREKWLGLAPTQTDGVFFQFVSMDYGIRAIAKILATYFNTYKLNTVRSIITRWAPPVENDTNAYVRYVASVVGVSPDTPINVNDPAVMDALVRGIIRQENGPSGAAMVADNSIGAGISLAMA